MSIDDGLRGPIGTMDRRNSGVAAAEVIRDAITEGRLRPGQRLKEAELATELGLSRTPVREALLLLGAEGAIELQPNRGATVRSYSSAEIEDLYGLRATLEGYACRLATERADAEVLAQLDEICDAFDALVANGTEAELMEHNDAFHQLILNTAAVPRLRPMVRSTVELPLVYKSFHWYSPEQRRLSSHYHRQITVAIHHRDASRASLVMREHVYEARDFLVLQLRRGEELEPPLEQMPNAVVAGARRSGSRRG